MATAGQKAAKVKAARKSTENTQVVRSARQRETENTQVIRSKNYSELADNPKSNKGMGFKAAAKAAAKSAGVSPERGAAIVAAGRAKASKKAVAANPNLKKVPTKGSHKTKSGAFKK